MRLDYITDAIVALTDHTSVGHILTVSIDPKRPARFRACAMIGPNENGAQSIAHAYAATADLAVRALNEQLRARSPYKNPTPKQLCTMLLHSVDMSAEHGWGYDLVATLWNASE